VVSFVIVAFAVFMLIRAINQLKRKEEAAPTTKECPQCFSAISIKAKRCPNCTSQL
jgi:large conductance mechanosensitive channel